MLHHASSLRTSIDLCFPRPRRILPIPRTSDHPTMPFEFDKYRSWCYGRDPLLLQKEFEKYTRQTMSGSAGTGVAIGLAPFTFGLSALFGAAAGGARTVNATKKLSIIEAELNRQGCVANLRKRDMWAGIGIGCTLGAVTHGVGGHLVESAAHHAVNHTANQAADYVTNHTAQQTVHHATSSGDYMLKAAEHGADKLAEKGGEALEERAYGEKVVSWSWRDLWDSDDSAREDSDGEDSDEEESDGEKSDGEESDSDEENWEGSDSSGEHYIEHHVEWSDSDDD